jgi:hypothetical protein
MQERYPGVVPIVSGVSVSFPRCLVPETRKYGNTQADAGEVVPGTPLAKAHHSACVPAIPIESRIGRFALATLRPMKASRVHD